MSNVKEMRIFSAEQIIVPDDFPKILKDYTKEVVRKGIAGEQDIVKFSIAYFEQLLRERAEAQGGSSYGDGNGSQKDLKQTSTFVMRKPGESVHDHYYIQGIIGNPYDSKARLGIHKQTGVERAIKEVEKRNISDIGQYMKKVKLLSRLDHPSIIKYLEMFEDEYSFYFVSEYMQGGDLWDAIFGSLGQSANYNESIAAAIMKQIIGAVNYLHKQGVIHRNLRSGNILFTEKGSLEVKIIDFDVAGTKTMSAAQIYEGDGGGIHGPYYCAPEIFRNEYGEKSDMWSIGVIMYFMLTGTLPFDGENHEAVIAAIKKGQVKHANEQQYQALSPEARDLIELLLNQNPKIRPNAHDALQHPWFESAAKGTHDKYDLSTTLQSLKSFAGHNKIKTALLGFFVQNLLSQQELNHLAQQFKEFDKDGSGALSPEELKASLREIQGLDYNESEVNELIARIDQDGDGEINYTEFLMAALNRNAMLTSERLEVAFRMFDTNGDGEIYIKELKNMLSLAKQVDELSVIKIMQELDGKTKATMKFKDFKQLMQKLFD